MWVSTRLLWIFVLRRILSHSPSGGNQRLVKCVHRGINVVGAQHGLGYFLAKELSKALTQAPDQPFQGWQIQVQRPCRLFVAQIYLGYFQRLGRVSEC